MTMTQQEKDALRTNWDQARTQVQGQFPGVTDDDLDNSGDQLPDVIASRTGQDRAAVEKSLKQIAQQYTA